MSISKRGLSVVAAGLILNGVVISDRSSNFENAESGAVAINEATSKEVVPTNLPFSNMTPEGVAIEWNLDEVFENIRWIQENRSRLRGNEETIEQGEGETR